MPSITFGEYSEYYDLINGEKDYRAEADYVTGLINRFNPGSTKLLELGCGTGNHAMYLSANGFAVTGIEKSEGMAEIARSKAIPGFDVVTADITRLPHREEKFDCALSLFHVMSYITGNDELLAVLNGVAASLHAGGLFIFDAWYTPAVYTQQPEIRTRSFQNDTLTITRSATPSVDAINNIITIDFSMEITRQPGTSTLQERHEMRHFGIPEIKLIARLSGFQLVLAEEFMTGRTPGTGTWGVCFLLQKL